MRCIGAAGCNVAVSVSLDILCELCPACLHLLPFATDAVVDPFASLVVIRVGHTTPKECDECYSALRAFAGWRVVIDIGPALRKCLLRVVPTAYQGCVRRASQALLMPDFSSRPWPSHCMSITGVAQDAVVQTTAATSDTADFVVELKPKAAWAVPVVRGICVDGVTHFLHAAKLKRCRFSLMRVYKSQADDGRIAAKDGNNNVVGGGGDDGLRCGLDTSYAYCPNELYDTSRSTSSALRALLRDPQNNLRVTRRGQVSHASLTAHELTYVAQALDAASLWPALAHLQLYGLPPRSTDAAGALPVLDIELLYYWSQARDMQSVRWLVPDGDVLGYKAGDTSATLPRCACALEASAAQRALTAPPQANLRAILPLTDLDACITRFYSATTARDVSVMVAATAPRSDSVPLANALPTVYKCGGGVGEGVCVDFGCPRHYIFRIAVIDLDCKRHKPLAHYWRRDADILRAWDKRHANAHTTG